MGSGLKFSAAFFLDLDFGEVDDLVTERSSNWDLRSSSGLAEEEIAFVDFDFEEDLGMEEVEG